MNFFDHKDLGNHHLQLCPKVVKHPVFVILIIITNVSVYINHQQYYKGHKPQYMLVRHRTSSEAEQQQVFKWIYKFVTSSCHLTCHTSNIVKKWPMSLKFQVYGNHKVKLKFDAEVKWHPWLVCHFIGQNYHVLILWNTGHYLPDIKCCLSSVAFLCGLENMVVY